MLIGTSGFSGFIAIIFDADIPLDFNRKEVFVSFLRSRYIMNLRQRMEEELEYGSQVNEEQLIVFIDSFVKLTTEQTMEFFQRICPCEKIDSGLEGCLRLASEEKINTLFNQINSLEVLIPDGLHWVQEEKKQTPSTLGADRNVRQFCVRIFNNAANLDMLREYDQIIGCVTDSVENIRECVYNIKHSDIEKDPNNIFEINKELIDREAEKQEKYSNDTMNLILFILTIVSTVSAIYQIVDYVVDYRYQSAVKNSYSVIANVIAMIFIIVVFLVKRKKRNHTDKKW